MILFKDLSYAVCFIRPPRIDKGISINQKIRWNQIGKTFQRWTCTAMPTIRRMIPSIRVDRLFSAATTAAMKPAMIVVIALLSRPISNMLVSALNASPFSTASAVAS